MELTITNMIPHQLMIGIEFYPEEVTDEGKHYWNEFTIYFLLVSIKIAW